SSSVSVDIDVADREDVLQHDKDDERQNRRDTHDEPLAKSTCDPHGGGDPNGGCGGQPLDELDVGLAEDDTGADEPYAGHHALKSALQGPAQGILVLVDARDVQGGDCKRCGAQRDERQGSNSDRFALESAVDTESRADGGCCDKANDDIP